MAEITAAQVWYIAHVYPERVSADEAQVHYEHGVRTDADRLYWESAAKIINALCGAHG